MDEPDTCTVEAIDETNNDNTNVMARHKTDDTTCVPPVEMVVEASHEAFAETTLAKQNVSMDSSQDGTLMSKLTNRLDSSLNELLEVRWSPSDDSRTSRIYDPYPFCV
jgi:hypothetical protein